MNFDDLLKLNESDAGEFRLLRHGYKELDPLDTFQTAPKVFDAYQSFQTVGKYGDAKFIAVFAPYHGQQALFLGVWSIDGEKPAKEAPESALEMGDDFAKQFGWQMDGFSFYTMIKTDIHEDLSERLVIDWGGSTVSWLQRKTDKPVIAILPPAHIQEFQSYDQTIIDWVKLKKMIANPTNNATWYNALKAVNGIYCITDKETGRLYVGSAYGKNGIWARWTDYAMTGHGDNKKLVELLEVNPKAAHRFQFTILEILPSSSTANDAIKKEYMWMKKLGSQQHGYNDDKSALARVGQED